LLYLINYSKITHVNSHLTFVIRLGFIRASAFVDFIDTSEFDIEILSSL